MGEWLLTEAGAAYLFGVAALIGWGIAIWQYLQPKRNIYRPAKVVFQKNDVIRLLDIHSSHRNQIRVSYYNSKVFDLQRTSISVYNSGLQNIDETVSLRFSLIPAQNNCRVLDFTYDEGEYALELESQNKDRIAYRLVIPFLNSYELHKQLVKLSIVTDGEYSINFEHQTGKGWSTKYTDRGRAEYEPPSKKGQALNGVTYSIAGLIVCFTIALIANFTINNINVSASGDAHMIERSQYVINIILSGVGWLMAANLIYNFIILTTTVGE